MDIYNYLYLSKKNSIFATVYYGQICLSFY